LTQQFIAQQERRLVPIPTKFAHKQFQRKRKYFHWLPLFKNVAIEKSLKAITGNAISQFSMFIFHIPVNSIMVLLDYYDKT